MLSSLLAPRFTAAVDRSYLESVQKTFGDWGFNPQQLSIIAVTATAVITLGVAGYFLNRYLKSRRPEPTPSNWITRPEEVHATLDQAMAQRSKVEMSFAHGAGHPSASCSLVNVSPGEVVLEAPSHVQVSEEWMGRTVNCMFGLLASKQSGMVRFHVFESQIHGAKRGGKNEALLSLDFPDKLVLQQKRVHLRVEPPAHYILGMALWPEILDEIHMPEARIRHWGKPLAKYVSGKHNAFKAVNFSAGGLKLEIENSLVKSSGCVFEVGEHYFLLLDLFEPQSKSKSRFWLNIKIKNRFEEFNTKKLSLGCQIVAQAELADKKAGVIKWREVPEDGLESLGNWAVQRHLELYREKGVVA